MPCAGSRLTIGNSGDARTGALLQATTVSTPGSRLVSGLRCRSGVSREGFDTRCVAGRRDVPAIVERVYALRGRALGLECSRWDPLRGTMRGRDMIGCMAGPDACAV
jgi:hypothetical protein